MSKTNNIGDWATGIADAIRDMRGTGEKINAQDYEDEIRAIGPLLDTLDITENGKHDVKDYKNVSVLVESEELETIKNLVGDWVNTENNIVLPYGVEIIGACAFERSNKTASKIFVTFPTTIIEMKEKSLSGVRRNYKGTFEEWLKIKKGSAVTSSSATYVSTDNDASSTSITFYNNTENASSMKFTEYTLSDDFEVIERGAFSHFYNSIGGGIIYVKSNVKYINNGCFYSLNGVDKILFEDGSVVGTTEPYPQSHFMRSKVKEVKLPILDILYKSMFSDCNYLESLTIPEGPTIVSKECFYNASNLKNIALPKTLQTIEQNAFYGCSSLTTLVIPENVSNMSASYIFSGMTGNIIMESSTPCTIGSSTFSNFNGKIYVPKGSKETFISATNWSKQASKIYEKYVVVFNVPTALVNNETITYSVDGGKTYQMFTSGTLSLNEVATIKIKSTDSSQVVKIGTSAGGSDVGTISNSELTFSFTTDTQVYLTIQ